MSARIAAVIIVGICLGACQTVAHRSEEAAPRSLPELEALYTSGAITLDGQLDEPVWNEATPYTFAAPLEILDGGDSCSELGTVMLAWDNDYLYVAGRFDDGDVIAHGKKDGMPHYKYGDLLEVFLWPDANSWYWEMYATPAGNKSVYFFPGPGAMTEDCFDYPVPEAMRVSSQAHGTLNQWKDHDNGWTTEVRIPLSELRKHGNEFPSAGWRILCARYNYNAYAKGIEYSSYPQLTRLNYHLRDEYARLVFINQ